MSLHEEIAANLNGYSKAMYATWFFYRPARVLLDAGEGVSSAMANFVFAIEKVFLSHGHYDHIGGLPGLLQSRRSARGDKEKPLEVHYPAGDELIAAQRQYVEALTYRVGYDLSWQPLEPEQRVQLGAGRDRGYLVPFRARHGGRSLALGFRIMEERKRLRACYAGMPEREIAALARTVPREELSEVYEKTLLAYTGDTAPIEPELVQDAEVLMHEATFLAPEDRDAPGHSTLEEAVRVAVAARVKLLVLFHVSSRYPRHEVERRGREAASRLAPDLPVVLFRSARKLWLSVQPRGATGILPVRDTGGTPVPPPPVP
ncbi:MAG: MBL fold metallo-hydrolase [Planctomycetes bacterium]|nr:MBL fold metallo-hydrolase [Planctomycetota bacterium]